MIRLHSIQALEKREHRNKSHITTITKVAQLRNLLKIDKMKCEAAFKQVKIFVCFLIEKLQIKNKKTDGRNVKLQL